MTDNPSLGKRGEITETEFGRLKAVVRDGEHTWLFECPGCGEWGELDDDQWEGRVSVDHTDTGCTYHETHNYFVALAVAGNRPNATK